MNPHEELCADLIKLSGEAVRYQFHDFKSDKYAMPKMELINKLTKIIEKVKEGEYDD